MKNDDVQDAQIEDRLQAHEEMFFPPKDVARMLGEEAHTIRFWEKFFCIAITRKEDKGKALHPRRQYTRSNVTLFKKIQRLSNEGLTLKHVHYQLVQDGNLPPESLHKYALEPSDELLPSEALPVEALLPSGNKARAACTPPAAGLQPATGPQPGSKISAPPQPELHAPGAAPVVQPPPLGASLNVPATVSAHSGRAEAAADTLKGKSTHELLQKIRGELSSVITLLRSPVDKG